MTDKEKIRAEIERQYEAFKAEYARTKGAYVAGRMDALDYIEQFIDSLPEESGRTLFEEIAYPGLNPTPKIPAYCTGVKGDPDPAGTSAWEVGIDAEIVKEDKQ